MVLIGLIVVAVVCMVIGVAVASAAWLWASVAVVAVAAVLLFFVWRRDAAQRRDRRQASAHGGGAGAGARTHRQLAAVGAGSTPAGASAVAAGAGGGGGSSVSAPSGAVITGQAATVAGNGSGGRTTLVVDGQPDYHRAGCPVLAGVEAETIPLDQAVEDGFAPCATCRPDVAAGERSGTVGAPADPALATTVLHTRQVWVADGYPEYHLPGCEELNASNSEPVPFEQAVEDGFQPCVVCNPNAVFAGDRTPGLATAAGRQNGAAGGTGSAAVITDVWVVDGRPEFHRAECERIAGLDSEPIPLSQAQEDGFVACTSCAPAVHTPDTSSTTSGDVWVVDGFPEYHRSGCERIAGLDSEPIPHDQAVEDGFRSCGVCRPDGDDAQGADVAPATAATTGAPAAAAAQVWVVDGFPDYHRQDCSTLQDLPAEPVPHDQAVEDGFTECHVCTPEARHVRDEPVDLTKDDRSPDDGADEPDQVSLRKQDVPPHAEAGSASGEVWVVDGYPDFHRQGCRVVAGLAAEPVPLEQAVEDGFAACDVCAPTAAQAPPDAVLPATAGKVTSAAQVWVVDGLPDYHHADCRTLEGLDSEPVPFDQAVEDGFAPCSVCTPQDRQDAAPQEARPTTAPVSEEPEAEPEPTPEPEHEPEPEPEPEPESAPQPPDEAPETGAAAAPAAAEQAPDLPFTPSATAPATEPASEPASEAAPEPAAEPAAQPPSEAASTGAAQVWVLNGRPRYHQQDCLIIKGQPAQPVPLDEAVADGFLPCSLCSRDF